MSIYNILKAEFIALVDLIEFKDENCEELATKAFILAAKPRIEGLHKLYVLTSVGEKSTAKSFTAFFRQLCVERPETYRNALRDSLKEAIRFVDSEEVNAIREKLVNQSPDEAENGHTRVIVNSVVSGVSKGLKTQIPILIAAICGGLIALGATWGSKLLGG